MKFRPVGFLIVAVALVLQACTSGASAPAVPAESATAATRILFVGNSATHWPPGMGEQFTELSASATPPPSVETDQRTRGGATFEFHWKTNTPEIITDGAYDVVVLQGAVAIAGVDSFKEHARLLVGTVRDTAARPVLFIPPEWDRPGALPMDEIVQAYSDIAAELGVDVAPVGLAFIRASEERPEINLIGSDDVHQSTYGGYLAVNVIYLTIFGSEHPVTLAYLPEGIAEDEATFLQRIARETVKEYGANRTP